MDSESRQRSTKTLSAMMVGAPKSQKISVYTLQPGGTWSLALDTNPGLDAITLVHGEISRQQLHPGQNGVSLPPIGREALQSRTPMGMLARTGTDELVSLGYAPVMHSNTEKPLSVVAVEIPMPQVAKSTHMMEVTSLVVAVGFAVLVSGLFLAISLSRRTARVISLLTERIEQQEVTLNSQHINLG